MAEPSVKNCIGDLSAQRKHYFGHESLQGHSEQSGYDYITSLADNKFSSIALRNRTGKPFIQPRGGYPSYDKQRDLSIQLEKAGADFIPLTIDSHTRQNDYERAAMLLKESEESEKDLLNGYPLVAHGYELTRELIKSIDCPFSLRHGTPDARLLVENALASGICEIEGGALCYTLPYASQFPLDRALFYWQYVDRLCAEYSLNQRAIHRESFGPLTATLVPPVIIIAIQIIEMLLAAEQGITSFSISFGQSGSFEQDVALAKILRKQTRIYLDRFGFSQVQIYLVYHQWMGAFPYDRERAQNLISMSAMIGAIVNADKIVIKTRDEAFGIPTIESNVSAIQQVHYILSLVPEIKVPSSSLIEKEVDLITGELIEIMDAVFNMPGQTFCHSVFHSIRKGIIDVPFSPHYQNANKLLAMRDNRRGIRIKEHGALPLSAPHLKMEKELLEDKQGDEGQIIDKISDDIFIMV